MFHSQTELFEDIILSEDATMEFKREMPHRDSMADEIAAFANSDGGTILIGIDDNREIVGDDDVGSQVNRRHFLDGRGEGVGIILNESEQLSGKIPEYELHNDELCLTIFAAKSL